MSRLGSSNVQQPVRTLVIVLAALVASTSLVVGLPIASFASSGNGNGNMGNGNGNGNSGDNNGNDNQGHNNGNDNSGSNNGNDNAGSGNGNGFSTDGNGNGSSSSSTSRPSADEAPGAPGDTRESAANEVTAGATAARSGYGGFGTLRAGDEARTSALQSLFGEQTHCLTAGKCSGTEQRPSAGTADR
ncbi:MAG: hypothetical protein JNL61_08120 [Rhizobiaceae bacterium]|nr:hypothetical protein [Rhizobiaceae bacterium]